MIAGVLNMDKGKYKNIIIVEIIKKNLVDRRAGDEGR
jgi:hypothetical protein